jgi:hypothetical protein
MLSVLVLTQAPLHSVCPAMQFCTHMPLLHTVPIGQMLPHIPQFSGSVDVLTQTPEQLAVPAGHVQTPPEHDAPPVHARPQPPQFKLSVLVLTHAPLQSVWVGRQLCVQMPELHTCPIAHILPHMPQFCTSLDVSTHTPLQ